MKDNASELLYAEESRIDAIVIAIKNCAEECGAAGGILAVDQFERLLNLTNGGLQ